MRVSRFAWFIPLAGIVIYFTTVALSFYARIHVCWYPPTIVSDEARVSSVITYARNASVSRDPDFRLLDPDNCCRVEAGRSSTEDRVTLASVASFNTAEIVRVSYGATANKIVYFRTTLCGAVITGD